MASFSTDDVERALTALAADPVFQRLNVAESRPEFGEDANGDPAVWVSVILRDEAPLELARGSHCEERQRIRAAVQTAGWVVPVYIRFRRVSEDLSLRPPAATK